MEQKGLLKLAIRDVADIPVASCNLLRYISPELALVRSLEGMEDIASAVLLMGQPYRLTEGRIVYMRSGYVRARVDLIEMRLEAHTLRVTSPGAVIEFLEISPDCDLSMLAFANSFMENWQKEDLLMEYLQGRMNLTLSLNEEMENRLEDIMSLMWNVLQDEDFSRETLQGMISVLFHQLAYFRSRRPLETELRNNRQKEVFNRFMNLVNKYAVCERNVKFYADNLFLTSRYLSTLIRETSGKTVMEWVNEAVLQEAKLMLCHTDKLVYEIADELNFPNPSFFCKFFRRMTGKTPHAYRQERQ